MSSPKEYYRVGVKQLPLRELPNTSSRILQFMNKDDEIEAVGFNEQGDWIQTNINGVEGWLYKKCTLKEVTPWLNIARKELGIKEIPGKDNNPRVVEFLNATSNISAALRAKDETPWCSAFVNWCMQQAGFDGTKNALARSWQDWGEHIDVPYIGCIVVFQREQNFGHVGFYIGETETHIKVLGGNQQNPETGIFEVSEKLYPKKDFLEYRSLKKT